MNDHELSVPLRRELDKQPIGVVAEYLGERLGANTGKHEIRIALVDGRYQTGRVLSSFASFRSVAGDGRDRGDH